MPRRIPTHRPAPKQRVRPAVERANAYQRGYCDASWFATRKAVLVRDNWECRACGKLCDGKREAHVDHVVPKRLGGTDDLTNLQTLCVRCHSSKTVGGG
jgi:5-methylcytosine-specific restriction protein A